MRLDDIAMIAADTSRSRAYLQALIRHSLVPNFVLILADDTALPRPGQYIGAAAPPSALSDRWNEAYFAPEEPITTTIDISGISHATCTADINDPTTIDAIRSRPESVFIYSGFGGVLLRKPVLASRKRFLHVHGGYLPTFKGSTANYFSLLTDGTIGASSLFLTEEIDSGPILLRKKFPPPARRDLIDHVFDPAARAVVLVETLREYVRRGFEPLDVANDAAADTYYIIHPVLKHIAILGTGKGNQCA